MSNGRTRKRPEHQCDDQCKTVTENCGCCGYANEIDLCGTGVTEYLAEQKAELSWDCEVCHGADAFHIRIGRAWEGEPRFIWRCDNGCSPGVLRAAALARGVHPDCVGAYGADGERTALYRMFDAAGGLLYIGISKDFGQRWKKHEALKPWWLDVQRQTVEWFGSRAEALDAEEAAIKAERPKFNIQHSAGAVPAAFRKS